MTTPGQHTQQGRRLRSLIPLMAAMGAILAAPAAAQSPAAGQSAAAGMTVEAETAAAGKTTDTSFCGDKPITLGIHDGYGVNAWSVASFAAVESEAAKCPNVTVIASGAGGDLQKAISDINWWVAQGVNAITIIPDAGGPAQLPSLQDATKAWRHGRSLGLRPQRRRGHRLPHLRRLGYHR